MSAVWRGSRKGEEYKLSQEWKQPNFEKHWEGANVILRTQNSNGKELYASKEKLAEKSSYFDAIFFSGLYEMDKNVLEIPCTFQTMWKILQIIHGSSKADCLRNLSSPDGLVDMFRTADLFEMEAIKEICSKRLDKDRVASTLLSVKVGDREKASVQLGELSKLELRNLLLESDESLLFSKKDVLNVYRKIAEFELPSKYVRNMGTVKSFETCAWRVVNTKLDLTKPWDSSDARIVTRGSAGMMLYTNSMVVSSNSDYLFEAFSNQAENNAGNTKKISVDVEYLTMKAILSLLHCCNTAERRAMHSTFPPILLFDMYRASLKLNIPVIKEYCMECFLDIASPIFFEFAIHFKLDFLKKKILEKMTGNSIREFLFTGYKDITYKSYGETRFETTALKERVLSLNDLRNMVQVLLATFRVERCVDELPHDSPPQNKSEKKVHQGVRAIQTENKTANSQQQPTINLKVDFSAFQKA